MITRKNQKNLTDAEKQQFLAAVQELIDSGEYGRLVAIHGQMSHRMHGSDMMGDPDLVGEQRFLPWHRAFLLAFEKSLRAVGHGVTVPYWDWVHERAIPAWLKSFRPSVPMPDGSIIDVVRYATKGGARLPTGDQISRTLNYPSFTTFTESLEGRHNVVHMWTGGIHGSTVGTMGNIMISPADPIFWLHHAQLDRLWTVWQKDHAGQGPNLSGAHGKLDPWNNVTAANVADIAHLGGAEAGADYAYA